MSGNNKLLVFSGNANRELAKSIAKYLKTELSNANVGAFSDGESQVIIYEDVRGKDVFVVQPTGPPANQNLMELLLMLDALKRASADRITAVIPYFGYARQDRKDQPRVPISAKLVANLITAARADRELLGERRAEAAAGPGLPGHPAAAAAAAAATAAAAAHRGAFVAARDQ